MPRPGPRPYECVRKAWHSDRHQPMRGSIISQIFRVVTEAHSPATRKNREWQEKLPIVVFRAEEIMYSKANSEAEYLHPDTLWDRLNDAIDTIIRKEEETETGEYLKPCIEAALVLGCVPVRASRSQRLSNPRTYLHHCAQESPPRAFTLSEKPVIERQSLHHTLLAPSNQLSIARPKVGSQSNALPLLDNGKTQSSAHIAVNNIAHLRPDTDRNIMPARAIESNQSMKTGSVHPLYYGTDCQNLNPPALIHLPQNQNAGNVIFGTPIGWSSAQPVHYCTTRELFPSVGGSSALDKPLQGNRANSSGVANVKDCDLNLSLGRNSDPPSTERRIHCEYEAGSKEDGRHVRPSSQNPKICLFQTRTSDDPFEPRSSRWASEGEVQDVGSSLRKRKMPFLHDADDGSIRQQPDHRPNLFPRQIRWPGRTSDLDFL